MYPGLFDRPLQACNSFFLFGPRGTGKTTWIKANCPDALYLDLLDSGLYTELLARSERLADMIPPNLERWIVLDEVQRVPRSGCSKRITLSLAATFFTVVTGKSTGTG